MNVETRVKNICEKILATIEEYDMKQCSMQDMATIIMICQQAKELNSSKSDYLQTLAEIVARNSQISALTD